MVREIKVEPHYPGLLRWWAQAMVSHSFDLGAKAPVKSFMEIVRYLQVTDPDVLQEIIEEYGDDTPSNSDQSS